MLHPNHTWAPPGNEPELSEVQGEWETDYTPMHTNTVSVDRTHHIPDKQHKVEDAVRKPNDDQQPLLANNSRGDGPTFS